MTSLWHDTAPPIATDAFHPDGRRDVVVVGAGLTGLVTALLLARAGRTVSVLEARYVGAVTTGNTTAKLSLLQGTHLSKLRSRHGAKVARAYVEGNREGQQWLLRYLEEHGVAVQHHTAYTYAGTPKGVSTVRDELSATQEAGLDTTWVDDLPLPYETHGAVALADQAQFDPMHVLAALAEDLRGHGGLVHEGVRVTGVSAQDPCVVRTDAGTITADQVVLATGSPILDRGLYFAKLHAERSYCVAFEGVDHPPEDMYLSADSPSRSLRVVPRADGDPLLVVGGGGHGVGRSRSPRRQVEEIVEWTTARFPGARETHRWSAQDYATSDGVPFVGALPRGRGRVHVATGYEKWGMSNAPAAALRLSAQLLGGSLPWADVLGHRVTGPTSLLTGAGFNAAVGAFMTLGWGGSMLRSAPEHPAEGLGGVGRRGGRPTAVSTVDGTTCAVSAICPHLGGILAWNDAERSWDCPLHGSRFSPEGEVLEGPATRPLARHDSTPS